MTKGGRVEARAMEHFYISLLQPLHFSSVLANILFHHLRGFKNPSFCPTTSLKWIVDSVYLMKLTRKKQTNKKTVKP